MTNAPTRDVEFIRLHPSEFPGVSVLDTSLRSYPNGGNVGGPVLGYLGAGRTKADTDRRQERRRVVLRAEPQGQEGHEHT